MENPKSINETYSLLNKMKCLALELPEHKRQKAIDGIKAAKAALVFSRNVIAGFGGKQNK